MNFNIQDGLWQWSREGQNGGNNAVCQAFNGDTSQESGYLMSEGTRITQHHAPVYYRIRDGYGLRVVCPSGWQLPSDDDWKGLIEANGGNGCSNNPEHCSTSVVQTIHNKLRTTHAGNWYFGSPEHQNSGTSVYPTSDMTTWAITYQNNGYGIYNGDDPYSHYGYPIRCVKK